MKRFVLLFFIALFHLHSSGQTNTWVGAAVGAWSLTTNWSLGHAPTAAEDVLINTNCNINVNVFSAGNCIINSLRITGTNITVTLNCAVAATRRLRMSSTSSTTKGLSIEAGNTLIFDAVNTSGTGTWICDLTGGNGVTGLIDGTLEFAGTGSSTGAARLNVYTGPSANASLIVSSTGTIIYLPDTDNTNSIAGTYLTMQNGSTYEIAKDNGFFPQATWEPNSLARASSPGTTVPGFVDGMTYGNLEWNCPFQNESYLNVNVSFNNVNFISTSDFPIHITGLSSGNHTMTVNGNLDISGDTYIDIVAADAPAGSSGKIILKGHFNSPDFGGVLATNGVSGTTSKFELQGTSNQNITNNGLLVGVRLEFIMNGDSATLLTPLTLPGNNLAGGANLQLLNGKIITTAANILRLNDNATVSGGSSNSFVSGPMRKVGDDDFIFPVGKGSIYAPIGISNPGGLVTDMFTAEYKRANPQSTNPFSPAVVSGMNHVSYVEYWSLVRNSGSASKKVSLDVHATSFCKLLANTYVSQWNGTAWTNQGGAIIGATTTVGMNQTGTIMSTSSISNFTAPDTAFTLITELDETANPLPITLISFDAIKLTNTKSSVNWELATVCSANAKFEIQKTDANKKFTTISTVGGSETNRFYNFIDNGLKNGISYYRLKMIDEDGKITYSKIVAVINGVNGLLLTSLIPTIVANNTSLTVASSGQQKLDLIIADIQGRVVLKRSYTIAAGNTNIEISLSGLSTGAYQLVGLTSEGKTNVIRFIKQ